MVSDRFRLRYQLTLEDLKIFNSLIVQRHKSGSFWMASLAFLVVGLLITLSPLLLSKAGFISLELSKFLILAALVGAVLVMLVQILLNTLARRGHGLDQSSFLGEHTLAAYERGGLQVGSVHTQSSYDWPAFSELTQGPKILVLWLDKNIGIIIPTRAFSDKPDMQEFVDFVRERIGAHRQVA